MGIDHCGRGGEERKSGKENLLYRFNSFLTLELKEEIVLKTGVNITLVFFINGTIKLLNLLLG